MAAEDKIKVAIIGSGVSGLGAAWLLSENKSKFDVTLYEKNDYIGGHTNTRTFTRPNVNSSSKAKAIPVDTGFIVFNLVTYPNLVNFFKYLKVPFQESNMSFSVSRDEGALEWAGTDMSTVFCQWKNLFSLRFWYMLADILRFNFLATELLELPLSHPDKSLTIGAYLDKHGYGEAFTQDYLIPMTAAIWSTSPSTCWDAFPAETLIRFMHNHHLLQVINKPPWYTVTNGSKNYVDAVLKRLSDVRLKDGVKEVVRSLDKKTGKHVVTVVSEKGTEKFDYVIVAAHGDQARSIVKDLTKDEAKVLNQVHFSKNTAVLHCDEDLMPKRRKAWSSWNYLTHDPDRASSKSSKVCLTYWMNLLQNINVREHGNVFVTMNPIYEPKKEKVIETYEYEHPLYTPQLVEAQRLLRSVNAVAKYETKTIYAGAWTLYGFHEDGLTSGLRAASLLGAQCPFEIINATNIRPLAPTVSHDVTGVVLEFIEYVFLWMWRIIDFLLVLTFPLRNTRSIIKTNMRGRI